MIAKDIRRGMVITIEGQIHVVFESQTITPGNLRGITHLKARNLKTGNMHKYRFGSTENVEQVYLETKDMEYLYQEGDGHVFMDVENYEQVTLPAEILGESMRFVKLNDRLKVAYQEGTPVSVELPSHVVLKVKATEPGYRGNSSTNVMKPATLETGLELKVPLYIEVGEAVKVDTATGEFVERVNK